jgi:hypothetical protein
MSLLFYGVFILGVVLGGLVSLVLYSLVAMAREGEESLEELELKMLRTQEYSPPLANRGKSKSLVVPTISDLYQGGVN